MKKSAYVTFCLSCFLIPASVCLISGCTDENIIKDSRDPVWTYDTGEGPYGSKPFIAGNKLVVCSLQEDADLGSVHCLNLSDGSRIWKMTDSTVIRNNPLVYDDLVIYGGYNVHALKLADGSHAWDYQDEFIHFALYSSPSETDGSAFVTSSYGMYKLGAADGRIIWKNPEFIYQNLSMSAPAYSQGKVYYATLYGQLICLNASTGASDWMLAFDNGFTNAPLVTNDRIYVGCHESDASKASVFCYKLDGITRVWSANIWQVTSDLAIDGDKLFVVGGSTLYCLSASDGSEKWKVEMTAGAVAEPVVSDGKVYIGTGEMLMCFDESNGKFQWSHETADGKGFTSPAFSSDHLYASCEDGKIYCFEK